MSPLTHLSLGHVLFNLHILEDFLVVNTFLLLISGLILLWSEDYG